MAHAQYIFYFRQGETERKVKLPRGPKEDFKRFLKGRINQIEKTHFYTYLYWYLIMQTSDFI